MFPLRWKSWEFMSTSSPPMTWPPPTCPGINVILLGVRAYAAREELKTYNSRLLDYVKNGGVMIVQYNTPEYDHNFGPYPYVMGRNPEEVTDEASKMDILDPQESHLPLAESNHAARFRRLG